MQKKSLYARSQQPAGTIALDGSKSISNRALIINALAEHTLSLHHLSTSNDTQTLTKLLNSKTDVFDAQDAGTTFRFMTAYLAFKKGKQILTGTEQMKNRPIEPLVSALNQLGANIRYVEKYGFPPLFIDTPDKQTTSSVIVNGGISSQFITAILLMAPALPLGVEVLITGSLVSRPYIEMTLKLLKQVGIKSNFSGNRISILPQKIRKTDIYIESDWTAASYYYALLALSKKGEIELKGLEKNSWQGDAALSSLMEQFGVKTSFGTNQITIKKEPIRLPQSFVGDFRSYPDLAQTFVVICAGLGIRGKFSGLSTLRIKETDRIAALQNELAKINVQFIETENGVFTLSGKARFGVKPIFKTYVDHRMAMAFAPLALLHPIEIENPDVVKKSYPSFWADLEILGLQSSPLS